MSRAAERSSVAPGTRVGRYEVESFVGAGGMGEVYVARDVSLERRVALKVLPPGCASDRVSRFLREARAASALNHPAIVSVFEAGEDSGIPFLAMELIAGQPLSNWMQGRRGLERSLEVMAGVADGLTRAHAGGIVHRDIKPDNILVGEGFVKIVDFGVAKLTERERGGESLTGVRTAEGALVGTVAYMSPEQIEGRDVDWRSDVFSFGVVLYEVVSGRHPFRGRKPVDTMHAITHAEPSLDPIPARLRRIVRRCLEKEPERRYHSMTDVALDLRESIAAPEGRSGLKMPAAWWWAGATGLLIGVLTAALVSGPRADERDLRPLRTSIVPPEGHQFEFLNGVGAAVVSPDGRSIVFAATRDGKRRLWLRRLDDSVPQPIAATEEAINPFWSPDGRSIAFFAEEKLKRIDIGATTASVICDAPLGRGGSWGWGGTIVFAGRASAIMQVPATGGTPAPVTELDRSKGETTHRWPFFLPDGRHFLYLAGRSGQAAMTNTVNVGSIDGKMRKVLLQSGTQPMFLNGYLLFFRQGGVLYAQKFDERQLSLAGEPFIVAEPPIAVDQGYSRSMISVSPAGTAVYQAGPPLRESQLVWFARSGQQLGTVGEPERFGVISLSHDLRTVFFSHRVASTPANLWAYDLERGTKTRVTFGNTRDNSPVVSHDGRALAFASGEPGGVVELRLKDLVTGTERSLIRSNSPMAPSSWSPDDGLLLVSGQAATARGDLWAVSLRDGKRIEYLSTPDIEGQGRFSPDGKWVVYQTDATGPLEVFVSPFPNTKAKWQVSLKGGSGARWRGDGGEIFYAEPAGNDFRIMAVPVTLGETPQFGRPVPLFTARPPAAPAIAFDVSPDGQRFLIPTRVSDEPAPPLTVVQHFDADLAAHDRAR